MFSFFLSTFLLFMLIMKIFAPRKCTYISEQKKLHSINHKPSPRNHNTYAFTIIGSPTGFDMCFIVGGAGLLATPSILYRSPGTADGSCGVTFNAFFRHAVLHLAGGKDCVISAPNKTPSRIHVKRARLNGKSLPDLTLTHQQIMAGGTLEFTMK